MSTSEVNVVIPTFDIEGFLKAVQKLEGPAAAVDNSREIQSGLVSKLGQFTEILVTNIQANQVGTDDIEALADLADESFDSVELVVTDLLTKYGSKAAKFRFNRETKRNLMNIIPLVEDDFV